LRTASVCWPASSGRRQLGAPGARALLHLLELGGLDGQAREVLAKGLADHLLGAAQLRAGVAR
jgi:hypothetical protein